MVCNPLAFEFAVLVFVSIYKNVLCICALHERAGAARRAARVARPLPEAYPFPGRERCASTATAPPGLHVYT
jgi:hypothetical protein